MERPGIGALAIRAPVEGHGADESRRANNIAHARVPAAIGIGEGRGSDAEVKGETLRTGAEVIRELVAIELGQVVVMHRMGADLEAGLRRATELLPSRRESGVGEGSTRAVRARGVIPPERGVPPGSVTDDEERGRERERLEDRK